MRLEGIESKVFGWKGTILNFKEGERAGTDGPRSNDRALRALCIAVALIAGFVQAWVNRFYVSYDGVSYLDMADAYLSRSWHVAINGFWNPLYSWIVGLAFLSLRPNAYWEYPVVHLVNLFAYAATVAAFEFFLSGLLRQREDAAAIRVVAYALFLWTSLEMIHVWMVSPDMLVAASVYLALGILQRPVSKWSPVLLGATLAAGYYAKSVMIPIGCIVLLANWKTIPRRQWITAVASFAILSLPLILMLSQATGHLTIGETGRLNYAWFVDGVAERNWQGGPDRAGNPIHPARIALESPRVYEFGGIFPTTYPMWYDVSYWFRGLHVWLAPRGFIRNTIRDFTGVAKLMVCQGGGFLAGWAFCFLRSKAKWTEAFPARPVWFVGLGAIFLYCAVHCESRYLAAFFAIFFLIPFVALRDLKMRWAVSVAVIGLVCAVSFASISIGEKFLPWENTPVNTFWQVATGLQKLGLKPGDNVGLACGGQGMPNSRWARLARVHIVAEMDRGADFWQLSQAKQQEVLGALAASGAKLAVTNLPPPGGADANGWVRVGSTTYYAHPLNNAPGL